MPRFERWSLSVKGIYRELARSFLGWWSPTARDRQGNTAMEFARTLPPFRPRSCATVLRTSRLPEKIKT
jgi:hypothetical protein